MTTLSIFTTKLEALKSDPTTQKTEFITSAIRSEILAHQSLASDESDFFDLTPIIRRYGKIITQQTLKGILDQIIQEIVSVGFKVRLSFGDTAMFIFLDEPPTNCY